MPMYLQETFDVDVAHKDIILKYAGKAHRTYRTWLAKYHLRDKDGNIVNEPPSMYAHVIGADDWKAFIEKHTKNIEFMVYVSTCIHTCVCVCICVCSYGVCLIYIYTHRKQKK